MGKEIVVNAEKAQTRIAILENGCLAELYIEDPENARTIGDIYLGRIRKVMPSIQAAFIDIGQKQDAFLHFSDVTEGIQRLLDLANAKAPTAPGKALAVPGKAPKVPGDPDAPKQPLPGNRRQPASSQPNDEGGPDVVGGRPVRHLQPNRRILVKIVKEPISSKGSRVSTDISMAGRFLVLVPLGNGIAVSKKIYSYKERRRLKALATSLVPPGLGLIVRTVADGKNAKALDTDLNLLLEKWHKLKKKIAECPDPPLLVHQDVNMLSSVMRDLFSEDYDRVLIDDERLYRNVRSYTQAVAPQMTDAIRHHRGKKHVFEEVGIHSEIQEAFEGRVNLPGGGYLFIEHTEAMHVIDVNSGRAGRGLSQEENSLRVNLEAARVIVRQIRLRDLGGIIVVDFIDLRGDRNRKKVFDEVKKEFKRDRAVTKVLPMSDFGIVQITRQRIRPSVTTNQSADFLVENGLSKKAVQPASSTKNEQGDAGEQGQESASARSAKKNRSASNQPQGRSASNRSQSRSASNRSQGRPASNRSQGRSASDRSQGRSASNQPRRSEQAYPVPMKPEKLLPAMEKWIDDYRTLGNMGALTLHLHPFTATYLTRGVLNQLTRWSFKHFVKIRIRTDSSISPLSFCFSDARTGEDLTEKIKMPNGPSRKGK